VKVGVYAGKALATTGGGFVIVHEIAKALARRGGASRHQFTLITAEKGPATTFEGLEVLALSEAWHESTADQLKRRALRKLNHLRGRQWRTEGESSQIPGIEELLTREKIDLMWYLSVWECISIEIPFITVVWDLQHRRQPFFPEVSEGGEWDFRERWMSKVLRRAAMIVAGNEVGRDEIERFYGAHPERIRLMPHPTPTLGDPNGDAPRPRLIEGDYIFYPAQFWPHKNHVNLLLALRILREHHGLDVSLALTGADHGNLPFVRQTARDLGLTDHVHFLGFVPRSDLTVLYRDALALTYVTFFGPENLPTLEALASGCPVVASDVAGAREQLGDAALIVDPKEPEQIAAAVVRIRSEPGLRQRLIDAGAARARTHTAADFVAGIEKWLDEFEAVRRCWPSGTNFRAPRK
jgi:glycosyltransferase involved in cell wall biosynthesis